MDMKAHFPCGLQRGKMQQAVGHNAVCLEQLPEDDMDDDLAGDTRQEGSAACQAQWRSDPLQPKGRCRQPCA